MMSNLAAHVCIGTCRVTPEGQAFHNRYGRIRYSFPLPYMTNGLSVIKMSVVIEKGDKTIEQKKYRSMEQYLFHVQNG